MTQSSIFTLLIFISVYWLLKKQQWLLAGLAGSLLLYKPQIAIVLYIYLLLLRNRKIFAGLVIGALAMISISLIMTQGHLGDLIKLLPEFINHPGATPVNRITWLGFFTQAQVYFPQLPAKALALIVSLITLTWVLNKIAAYPPWSPKFPQVFSLIIITTLLSSFHAHYHEAVLLFFPLFYTSSLLLSKNSSICAEAMKIPPKINKNIDFHGEGVSHRLPSLKVRLIIVSGWLVFFFAIFSPFYPQPMPFIITLYLFFLLIIMVRELVPNYR